VKISKKSKQRNRNEDIRKKKRRNAGKTEDAKELFNMVT
jgi:hypothetical protein